MQAPTVRIQRLLDGPALAPPRGFPLLPTNPPGNESLLLGTVATCMTIAGVLIIVRIYTQWTVSRRFEIADCFIVTGYLVAITVIPFSILALHHSWGAHQWTIQLRRFFDLLYYINVLEALYGPLIFCVKMSIILQYLRMFAPHRVVGPLVYYGSWLLIVICTVFYAATTLLTIFACTPREKIWNKLYVGGHCMNYRAIIISTAIFNIISDVAILLLPVQAVWKLHIPAKKKIAIRLLFGTGLLACIASAMRAYYTMQIINGGDKADISYDSLFTAVWSYIECGLGVIVACTLSVPKLVQAKGGSMRAALSKVAKVCTLLATKHDTDQSILKSGSTIRLSSMDSHA